MDTTQLERNFEFYRDNQEKLFEQYPGRFLLIHDCAVVGSFENQIDAFETGKRDYAEGAFLVIRCTKGDSEYTVRNYHSAFFSTLEGGKRLSWTGFVDQAAEKIKEAMLFIREVAAECGVSFNKRHYDRILWLVERERFFRTKAPAFNLFFIKGKKEPESPYVHKMYGKKFNMQNASPGSHLSDDERESLRRIARASCAGEDSKQIQEILSGTIYDQMHIGEFYPLHMNLVGKIAPYSEESVNRTECRQQR
jgi:glutathione peroxidase-family protein